MQWQIPCGAFTVTDICKRLTDRTGVDHRIDADFVDYPIYLSVKGDNPQRIEKLTAAALRGKWEKVDHGVRLIHEPTDKDADFKEFERGLTIALEKNPLKGLPARDLYDMNPGAIIRFGAPSSDLIRVLPATIGKPIAAKADVRVRRFCFGSFEFLSTGLDKDIQAFSDSSQITFDTLPPEVEKLLGDDLKKPSLSPEERSAFAKAMSAPGGFEMNGKDPIVAITSLGLGKIGDVLGHDTVIALPDMSLLALTMSGKKDTVGQLLGGFSTVDNWTVFDNAAVARLPALEHQYPAQTRRSVLTQLLQSIKEFGVATFQDASSYVRAQRPGASESWSDAMLLVLSHIALDDSYIGDYPFNVRFGDSLTDGDWQWLRSGKPFQLSSLSGPAQDQLMGVLLQSRGRMDGSDPAQWPSLAPADLTLTPELTEEKVLVGWTSQTSEIRDAHSSGMQYQMRRKHLNSEPLYQEATRKKLKLTVAGSPNDSIETGFSQVTLVEGSKAVPYTQLPTGLQAEFKKGMEDDIAGRTPPKESTPP
jgi:hypothetical protein